MAGASNLVDVTIPHNLGAQAAAQAAARALARRGSLVQVDGGSLVLISNDAWDGTVRTTATTARLETQDPVPFATQVQLEDTLANALWTRAYIQGEYKAGRLTNPQTAIAKRLGFVNILQGAQVNAADLGAIPGSVVGGAARGATDASASSVEAVGAKLWRAGRAVLTGAVIGVALWFGVKYARGAIR